MKAEGNEQSIENDAKCSQNNFDKFAKNVQKHFSNEMKILSSLKTRIYPK
jgi:uncharacterized membrane-anchored protein YhcB (DUF1043 family)